MVEVSVKRVGEGRKRRRERAGRKKNGGRERKRDFVRWSERSKEKKRHTRSQNWKR